MASHKGVEWQQLSTPGSRPEIACRGKPIWKNTISENVASRLQLLSAWEERNDLSTSVTRPNPSPSIFASLLVQTTTTNLYMRPPPTKHEVICIYFMVCLIILETLALNPLMASTLDLRRCWWSWLCVFIGNYPCLLNCHLSYHSRLLFFADLTTFLYYFWQ